MPQRPKEELEAGQAFYARVSPDLDVRHFGAMWHTFSIGHLIGTNLDRIARRRGLSLADLHLLGTLRIERPARLRAIDLARTLHVSPAVLSERIAKLARQGLLVRSRSAADRRALQLALTPEGAAAVDATIAEISRDASFARNFRRLHADDQAALSRILGELHNLLDRDFVVDPR
jgi:DNA-binding MarR family transcriptional regulator